MGPCKQASWLQCMLSAKVAYPERLMRHTLWRKHVKRRKGGKEVGEKGIGGASVTPYVLERVRNLTGDESLQVNIRLVLNNAKVGADIAVAIASQSPSRSKL